MEPSPVPTQKTTSTTLPSTVVQSSVKFPSMNSTSDDCMIRARSSKYMSDADIDLLRIICELEAHEVPEGCIDKNDRKGVHYRGGMDRTRHG